MVYGLPWLDKSLIKRPLAIKWSTGDKMVYGLPWLNKTAKAAPVFHSSNHVLVPCEFRHTGPGVSEAELLECLYRVGDDKYQGKGCAWMAWRPRRPRPSPSSSNKFVIKWPTGDKMVYGLDKNGLRALA